jgi:Sulfotransferase domain
MTESSPVTSYQRLLVTGEMRSGTTFVANLLNSQVEAKVYADMLVTLFMEGHELNINDIKLPLDSQKKNILISNVIPEGMREEMDFEGINRTLDLSWLDIFNYCLTQIKGSDSPKIVGIKRTREEKYLKQLLDDGVMVVYCVRDPRDVVISSKNRFSAHRTNTYIGKWSNSVNNAIGLNRYSNFFLLKYEDLILNTDEVAGKLEEFLGIEIKTDLKELSFGSRLKYQNNSSFGDVKKLFDSSAVYRWKKLEDQSEAQFCAHHLAEYISELGYESGDKMNAKALLLHKGFKKEMRMAKLRASLKNTFKRFLG